VTFITAGVAATRGRGLHAFSVRKEVKGPRGRWPHRRGARNPATGVVITEDTVTRGTSLLEAAHVVRDYGAEVIMLFAVVDRGGTVSAMAAQEGIAFDALFTSQDLGFTSEEL